MSRLRRFRQRPGRDTEEVMEVLEGNPNIPLKSLQDQLQKKNQLHVSIKKTFKTKKKAKEKLNGDYKEQYASLR